MAIQRAKSRASMTSLKIGRFVLTIVIQQTDLYRTHAEAANIRNYPEPPGIVSREAIIGSDSSELARIPPWGEEWDRTLRNVGLRDFGKILDNAAKRDLAAEDKLDKRGGEALSLSTSDGELPEYDAQSLAKKSKRSEVQSADQIYSSYGIAAVPNKERSRYSRVNVLLISWKTEAPMLPVQLEINRLRDVLECIYHYEVEEFRIPDHRSHAEVNMKIGAFVELGNDNCNDLKIVYYAGHSQVSRNAGLVWCGQVIFPITPYDCHSLKVYRLPETKNSTSCRYVEWNSTNIGNG
jgi:hypothetical protein